MKSFRLLTWLDVRRIIAQKTYLGSQLPEGIVRLSCFSDALEVGIRNESDREAASSILKDWFGDWYEEDKSIIQLDIGDATLPVEFMPGEEKSNIPISLRPLWEEISYLKPNEEKPALSLPELSTDKPELPELIAFHSFKGGVGRTLHLAAYLFALQERAKELKREITILVIDADLEAPGLTYWNIHERQEPSVSFIDFLECYQYSPVSSEETLNYFAKEIQKSVKTSGMTTLYFLPAFLKEEQLLDTPILPENLVKNPQNSWECSDAIYKLGQAVKADYILIDLRAGLSEISSPILFDPRIERFLVTSLNEQSRQGTKLILEQLSHAAPPEARVSGEDCLYYDPSVIISMLTPELKDLPAFSDALEQFQQAYVQPESDDLSATRLAIKETDFHQELLYVNNWEEARNKLNATSIMSLAREWADSQLIQKPSSTTSEDNQRLQQVRQLKEVCEKYIYAEAGEGDDLLITEPLRNLANNFRDKLPRVVSIGAKGSGKTFNYLQLSRLKYWEEFLKYNDISLELPTKTYIFPLLQSTNLQEKAKNISAQARNEIRNILGLNEFSHSDFTDRIQRKISSNESDNLSEPDWAEFWINEIARSLGFEETNSLHEIDHELKARSLRIIFLFDGLEDVFPNIANTEKQKKALRALIDNLPRKLSEIRQANLGVIVFLRRDFLRSTIVQNLQQFESPYSAYELSWDYDVFLRLVLWLCLQAKVISTDKAKPENLSRDEIKEELQQLWGKKLGTDNSKEAYSDSWIFFALTDFNGRLQARDIVRFIFSAAETTVNNPQAVNFAKWSNSRLLPPQAIRRALKPCSEKKVEEAKQEYPAFREWIDQKNYAQSDKKIPFDLEKLDIDRDTVKVLKDMGVIYEDTEKEEAERFYIPEIFREGLGFTGKVARPRVMALKRKILGREIN